MCLLDGRFLMSIEFSESSFPASPDPSLAFQARAFSPFPPVKRRSTWLRAG